MLSKATFLLFLFTTMLHFAMGQVYPAFGREILVTITGDTVPDAMEPFISTDGNYLFYNSLNNGTTTTLYYASKVNDSVFNFSGRLNGANLLVPPHLDAVASVDSANRFFWVTTRNYGANYNNLFHGVFTGGGVIDTGRVYGNIYVASPGWIIMDAAINYNGSLLYYANAYFNSCAYGLPCYSQLGIAQKINDSTYNKIPTSDQQLWYVNDTGYLVYAENVTKDGLELYYTRVKKTTTQTELCVAVRTNVTDTFSKPEVLYTSPSYIIEAPSLTTDKTKLYYHKKTSSNYALYLRYRDTITGINEAEIYKGIKVYPNPVTDKIHIAIKDKNMPFTVELYDMLNRKIISSTNRNSIDVSKTQPGIYYLIVRCMDKYFFEKIVKL